MWSTIGGGMKTKVCANCVFFDGDVDEVEAAPYDGYCCRYPPKMVEMDGDAASLYPEVTKECWCGEWVHLDTGEGFL